MSEGRKAEGVLYDDRISAYIFPKFPFKWEIRGRKERDMGMIFRFLHGKL